MKPIFCLLLGCSISLSVLGQDSSSKKKDHTPYVYIMMKNAQLLEVNHGRTQKVTRDKVLVNQTTIHPDGTINEANGKTRKLREGEYITMDGKIRWLAEMDSTVKHP